MKYKKAPRVRKMNETLSAIAPLLSKDASELQDLQKILTSYLVSDIPLYGYIYSTELKRYIVYELPVDKKYNIVVRVSDNTKFTCEPVMKIIN
jgi:hypothetical protein